MFYNTSRKVRTSEKKCLFCGRNSELHQNIHLSSYFNIARVRIRLTGLCLPCQSPTLAINTKLPI